MPRYGISGPGEGWLDALFPSFTWMQVYDRRSETPIPVVIPPSGGTQPLVPVPAPVQVPSVVPRSRIPITNTQPPPLIPIGSDDLPASSIPAQQDDTMEAKVALSDWVDAGIDIYRASQQQTVWQAPAQFAGASVPSTVAGGTTTASGLPKGMYMDAHGHLVHRRRRRRPCITQTDLSLAWQISNLPNNANVKMFLAKCVK